MAFLALVAVVWPLVADEFDLEGEEEEEEYYGVLDLAREARDLDREKRLR